MLLPFVALLMAAPVLSNRAENPPNNKRVRYLTVEVDGLSIFYREAGPSDGRVLLLLHGFPPVIPRRAFWAGCGDSRFGHRPLRA
jgi:hypothetical protein